MFSLFCGQVGSLAGLSWRTASSLTTTARTTSEKAAKDPSRCLCVTLKVGLRRPNILATLRWTHPSHAAHILCFSSSDRFNTSGADNPRRAAFLRASCERCRETEVAGGIRLIQSWDAGQSQKQRYETSPSLVTRIYPECYKMLQDFYKKLCLHLCLLKVQTVWRRRCPNCAFTVTSSSSRSKRSNHSTL